LIAERPSPKTMKRLGLGYTPENRKEVGLVQILSSHGNLCLASIPLIIIFTFLQSHLTRGFGAGGVKG